MTSPRRHNSSERPCASQSSVPRRTPPPVARRRGGVYLVVLSTVTLVIVLTIAATLAARIGAERATASIDAALARRAALSGVDVALEVFANTLPQRAAAEDDAGVVSDSTYDNIRVLVTVSDPDDGQLSGRTDQSVLLHSAATVRNARQMFQVRLTPYSQPISSLSAALAVGDRITFNSVWFRGIGDVWALGDISASSSTIEPNVRSSNSVSGSTYQGTTQSSAPELDMPDADEVLEAFQDYATVIPFSSIPSGRIDGRVLSSTSNPFGAVNDAGIYAVDIGSGTLRLRDTRLVGTLLVIANNSGQLVIEDSVVAEPHIEGYPCLIVIGDAQFAGSGADLRESVEGVNYNPAGTPFEGTSDSDMTDTYGSVLKGIVYISDDLEVSGNGLSVIGSLIVGDDATFTGRASVVHQDWDQAPPGFGGGRWRIDEPTWKRTLN